MSREEQAWLLRFLRARMEGMVRHKPSRLPPLREIPEVWRRAGGVFVTLEVAHRVRGCSGSLYPRLPQRWQEAQRALERALHDPRYRPIRPQELSLVRISVTVVLAIEPIDHIGQLGGAEYGLVLRTQDGHEGVVLPYEGRLPGERLRWAYRKAGVAQSRPAQLYRLRAERFSE